MRMGILQCDDVAAELQAEFGSYPEMIESRLSNAETDCEFVTYRAIDGIFPQSVDECDGYIVTGSRYGVNDNLPWIDKLETFVVSLAEKKKKYVGICFGHQILAAALGGEVKASDHGWTVGITKNRIDVEKAWMDPALKSLKLVACHQDQVCKIPQGVEVLASSGSCPYYMLQYGCHMMSIQGHPEFSKAFVNALLDGALDDIPASRIRDGKASLAEDADDLLFMRWIANFVTDGLA